MPETAAAKKPRAPRKKPAPKLTPPTVQLEVIEPLPVVREAARVTLGDILPPPPPENPDAQGVTLPAEPSIATPKTEVDSDLQRDGWRSRIGEGYGTRDRFLREWRG